MVGWHTLNDGCGPLARITPFIAFRNEQKTPAFVASRCNFARCLWRADMDGGARQKTPYPRELMRIRGARIAPSRASTSVRFFRFFYSFFDFICDIFAHLWRCFEPFPWFLASFCRIFDVAPSATQKKIQTLVLRFLESRKAFKDLPGWGFAM